MVLFAQNQILGEYDLGLNLAYDRQTKKVTGYFENYSGWDVETKSPKFSCIFYIDGQLTENKINILTYYADNRFEDAITGTLEIVNESTIKIEIPIEHVACWNINHFADKFLLFTLEKIASWSQIKYVKAEKTFFYLDNLNRKKLEKYLVKNDFVCIDKIVGRWVYCTFYGNTKTKGWLQLANLN